MARRRRPIRYASILLIAIFCCSVLYVFGMALLQSSQSNLLSFSDLIIPRLIDVVIFLWLFWIGSSFGSFLNVVAWRMPRGESINGRSHCPRCQHQLAARDNFPVFGWLALRGRCRTCRLPISARYPIVESAVGMSIAFVGFAEINQIALPHRPHLGHVGPLGSPVVDAATLFILAYHIFAIAFVWAMGLIRFDQRHLPRELSIFGFGVLITTMLGFPIVGIVPWQMDGGHLQDAKSIFGGSYLDAWMRVLTALVAAAFYARCLAPGLCRDADPKFDPLGKSTRRLIDLILVCAAASIVVGWQMLPTVLILASLISLPLQKRFPDSDAFGTFSLAMPVSLSLHIMLWRLLHQTWFWPSDGSQPIVLLIAAGVVLLIPNWLYEKPKLESPPTDSSSDEA
ncbi:A24 family peptidase [Novipirellula aureliae]|uniref:A24 family peptidase n=1 Tax=Novipirellula aureliae TaxID=2527966 RepID=UPI0028F414B7|nr:prepilin peptidase [Novipirellula aureliae]